jgi:hypothetical protein
MFNKRIAFNLLAFALAGTYASHTVAAPAAGSPYFTDTQHSYVEDATSKSIGQVNMITCFMSNMKPDALVNQPAYIALVDQNKCDPQRRGSGSGASDGSAQAASYMNAIVKSTRTSNTDPMVFNVWVNDENGGQADTIYLHASATAAPTAANPYGQFRLDFCGVATVGNGSCMMNGAMQGSDGALSYFETESGGGGGAATTALKLSSVGTTTGSGRLDSIQSDNNGPLPAEIFDFSYNQDYFLRGTECFSRDATDPGTGLSVWNYGMYDSVTGEHVALNSGFPIQYTAGGTTYQGFLGYWGLSLPTAATATMSSGATVQKVNYQSSGAATTTNYTVVIAGGKLTKYTKKTKTLLELDKIQFNTWVGDITGFIAGATPNTQYIMHWDETSGTFTVTGQSNCDQNGCQSHDLAAAQVAPSFWSAQGGIQGWSDALGGELFIDLSGPTSDSSIVPVIYRTQDMVYPTDMPPALHCLSNCPTAASLAAYFVPGTLALSPYTAASNNNWMPTQLADVVDYNSTTTSPLLMDATPAAVTLAAAAFQSQPQYQNGVRSGRLFVDLTATECSLGSGTYCDNKVNSADVYYIWETGPNNWNQFAAVKDASDNFVKFDAPLQVNYVVPMGAAYGQYAGTSLVLQYGGFGDLWGIPGSCVLPLNNAAVSCDTPGSRYVPQFVIPFDAVTGSATNGTTTYLVKWLEREIRFASKPTSVCTAAGLAAPVGVVLPTAADLKNPSDPNSDVYVGVKPVVTGAPRVIDGSVKF